MLDAILVTDNPYTNSTAISVGVALKNSKLITKSGSYWYYNGSLVDKDLIVRSSTSYVQAIAQSYAGYYVLPIAATWGDETFDDKAVASYGSFSTTTLYRDSADVVGSINTKGLQKYCSEIFVLDFSGLYVYNSNCTNYNNPSFWGLQGTSELKRFDHRTDSCETTLRPISFSCSLFGADVWYK
jgi:hypothetical protein